MSKKKQDLGEFDFDDFDSFGFDDGDFGSETPKDDRNPVTRAAGIAANTVKELSTDRTFIRDAIRGALPKGYLEAFDFADSARLNARSLYNEAKAEIAPGIRGFKAATKALLPKIETIVPQKLADRLKSWSDQEDYSSPESQAMRDGMERNETLAGIFDAKAQQDEAIAEQDTAQQLLFDKKAENRHKGQLGVLTGIQEQVIKLTSYQDQVLSKYQRKSLELQYQSYFAQRDLLAISRESYGKIVTNLADITKNTGLPDYLKINLTEDAKKFMRQRMFGSAMDKSGFGEWSSGFSGRLFDNIRRRVKGGVDSFNEAAEAAQMAGDNADLLDDLSDEEKQQLKDEFTAQGAASFLSFAGAGEKLGGYLGKYLKDNDKVRQAGGVASYIANNWQNMLQEWAGSRTEDGFLSDTIDDVKGAVGGFGGIKNSVQSVSMLNDANPVPFDGRTHRSITEVIPRLLSMILQSSEGIRTGTEAEETVYNYDRGEFTTRSRAAQDAGHTIVGKHRDRFNKEIDELVDNVDEEKTLSKDARSLLRKTIIDDLRGRGTGFSPVAYAKASKYKNAQPEVANELANHVKSYYGVADDAVPGEIKLNDNYDEGFVDNVKRRTSDTWNGIKQNVKGSEEQLARRTRDLRGFEDVRASLPEIDKLINGYAQAGQRDLLRDLGLLKKEGTNDVVDTEYLWRLYGGDPMPEFGNVGNPPNPNPPPRPIPPQGGPRIDPAPTPNVGGPTVQSITAAFDPELLREVVVPETDRLIEALKLQNPIERLEATNQILSQLLVTVDGIYQYLPSMQGGGSGAPSPDGAPKPKENLWDIRQLAKKGAGLVGTGVRKAVDASLMPLRLARYTAKRTWRGLKNIYKRARAKAGEYAHDVYIKGQAAVALTRKGMEEGQYIDVLTKKVIKSVKDITGPVVDAAGNYVITEEDFAKGLFNSMGEEIKLRGKAAGKWLWDKGSKAVNGAISLATSPLRALKRIAKGALKVNATWYDVYVVGELTTPKLYANKMRDGQYRSAKTGKQIYTVKEIDGAVIDGAGLTVLSEDDLKKGLVDQHGRPIRSLAYRAAGKIKDLAVKGGKWIGGKAKAGFELGKKLVAAPFKALGAMGRGIRDLWHEGVTGVGSTKQLEAQTEILESIYRLLDQRLARRKGKVSGDSDGDGVRNGAWSEIKAQREAAKAKLAAAKEAAKKAGGKVKEQGGKGLMGLLAGAGALLAAIKEKISGVGDILKSGFQGLMAMLGKKKALDVAGDLADAAGGGGRRGRGRGGLLRRGAGALGRGIGAVGRGIGAVVTGGGGMLGGIARGGLWAARLIGGIALTGAGGVLLAAGTVAYGGYKLYRHLKEKLKDLGYLRMAQYGFFEKDEDDIEQVRKLEALIEDHVTVNGGEARLSGETPWGEILSELGYSEDNPAGIEQFLGWLKYRFLPVYQAHRVAINQHDGSESVPTADSVNDKVKVAIAKEVIAKVPKAIYGYTMHPWGKPTLPANGLEEEAARRLSLLEKEFGERKNGFNRNVVIAGSMINTDGTVHSATLTTAQAQKRKIVRHENDLQMIDESVAAKRRKEAIKAGTFKVDGGDLKTIDPLGSVRMRAYGLIELEISDVSLLIKLEQEAWKEIKIGFFGGADFETDPNVYYERFGPAFGCSLTNAEQRTQWTYWFKNRFMPVLLVLKETLNGNAASGGVTIENAWRILQPEQLLKAAQAVIATTVTIARMEYSVWAVDASPFPGEPANKDSASCDNAIAGLKEKIKERKVQEEISKKKRDEESAVKRAQQQKTGGYGQPPATNPNYQYGGLNGGPGYTPQGGMSPADAAAYNPSAGFEHPGKGTGGDINALTAPKGDGYNNVMPMLMEVAKMVGVDPQLLATMCAVESDFKIKAKAGTSSAGGLFQFIDSTWAEMLKKYGAKYGIAQNTPKDDPRANALMGAEFTRDNYDYLAKRIGRNPNASDLYMAHFFGPSGAMQVLNGAPNDIASRLNPDAASANPTIFYENNGKGAPRSVSGVRADLDRRMMSKSSQYGITAEAIAETVATGKEVPVPPVPKDPTELPAKPMPMPEETDSSMVEHDVQGGTTSGVKSPLPVATKTPLPNAPAAPTTASAPSAVTPMSPTPKAAPAVPVSNTSTTVATTTAAVAATNQAEAVAEANRRQSQAVQQANNEAANANRQTLGSLAQAQLDRLTSIDKSLLKILDATVKLGEARKAAQSSEPPKAIAKSELNADTRPSPVGVGLG